MKKSLLLTILALLLTLPATAFAAVESVDIGQLRYTVDTDANTAEVYGPISSGEKIHDLVIPDFIDYNGSQIPVTSIRRHAFRDCNGLTGSLTIGDNVTTIEEYAFCGCSGFTGTLTIGDSVTTIGKRAFSFCSGFTGSLTIGDSVTTIGEVAFYYCTGFTGSLTIGNSVTTIGDGAFWDCTGFTGSLTIGDSVTTIEGFAFNNCTGFTGSLTIGDSVTLIGELAFSSCSNISSLDIKSTDLKINYFAFFGMDALQSITCYASTPPDCIYYGNYNCIFSLSTYTLPLNVPSEAIEKYKTATEWEKFTNIKPISDPATSITLNKSELNLTVGDSETLIASLLPENATETVTWSSADEAVATVDVDGLVKAVSVGTTTITATTVDGLTAECSVTVTEDSGVSGIYDNDLRVSVRGSVITVSGAGDKVVRIMAADGKPVFTAQGDCHANVVPGFYLVVVGDNVTKVVAKY
ncbi:MAG: leucine-rich repeat protein [Barnesiella sp.]|nr:leucine-rich repeat protein [Barnesiella sp.]